MGRVFMRNDSQGCHRMKTVNSGSMSVNPMAALWRENPERKENGSTDKVDMYFVFSVWSKE